MTLNIIMRILLTSNGTPFHGSRGGYPDQLKYLIQMFIEAGHTVTMLMWGFSGIKHSGVIHFRDILKVNLLNNETSDPYSQALLDRPEVTFILNQGEPFPRQLKISEINEHIKTSRADIIFFLQDIFVLESATQENLLCPSYIWFPLHYDPIDRPTLGALTKMNAIISLCPSTRTRVINQMKRDTYVVPHIIDFETPLPPTETKDRIRNKFNLENKYVILTIAGNYEQSGRKSIETTLLAFKEFNKLHPESLLWIHAPPLNHPKVYFVEQMMEELDIPKNAYKLTESTLEQITLQKMYKCADVYLCGSSSEGFGIPQLEAQYFGLPVVTTRFGAMEDYCWHGVAVEPSQKCYNTLQQAWWVKPSAENILKGLQKVYDDDIETTGEWVQDEVRTKMSYESVKKQILAIIEKK